MATRVSRGTAERRWKLEDTLAHTIARLLDGSGLRLPAGLARAQVAGGWVGGPGRKTVSGDQKKGVRGGSSGCVGLMRVEDCV